MSNQFVQAGTVVEVHPKHSLVKVDELGKVSAWLPVLQQANSFKRSFVSPQKGEQVVVLAGLYVLGSIYNQGCKEPAHGDNTDITEYSDGTKISYDVDKKQLSIDTPADIIIKTTANATLECKNASIKTDACKVESKTTDIKANKAKVDAPDIELGGADGGVVRSCDTCVLTGMPHPVSSTIVKAG